LRGSSSGPFTTTWVAASNLSVGSGIIVIFSYWAHLTAAPFRAGPPASVSGRLSDTTAWRRQPVLSRFPVAFPLPAFASRSSDSRRRVGPSSRSAYRTTPAARTSTGFPRSARMSYDRGGCPLYPEDGGAHPDRKACPAGACRFPAAVLSSPSAAIRRRGPLNEASTKVQAILRVSPAHRCAGLPSEPDEHLSMHPAQASPEGSRADRSPGRVPRSAGCRAWQRACMRRSSVTSAVPCSRVAIGVIVRHSSSFGGESRPWKRGPSPQRLAVVASASHRGPGQPASGPIAAWVRGPPVCTPEQRISSRPRVPTSPCACGGAGWLREVVARRPWMTGGMGTEGGVQAVGNLRRRTNRQEPF
jgi:hypothetical protein